MTFRKPFTTSKGIALFVAAVLFAVQLFAGFFVWDADGSFRDALYWLLRVIQFPIFELVDVAISLTADTGAIDFGTWIFITYMLKFYAISLAYSILAYHILRDRHWRLYLYALYLSLETCFLMFTTLDSKFSTLRHWRLAPIEIAFTFWLYRYLDKHSSGRKTKQ